MLNLDGKYTYPNVWQWCLLDVFMYNLCFVNAFYDNEDFIKLMIVLFP